MTDDPTGAILLDVNAAHLPDALSELPGEIEPGGGPVILAVTPGLEASGWASMAAVTVATHWGDKGHAVCLVDGGIEAPALHEAVGGGNDVGLVDHFLYGASLEAVVHPVLGDAFGFVPAGTYPPDPEALLRHEGWADLLDALADDGRIAVIYLPVELPGAGKLIDRAARVVVLAGEDETLPEPVTDALEEGRGRRFAPAAGEEEPEEEGEGLREAGAVVAGEDAGEADDDLGVETGFGLDGEEEAEEDAEPAGDEEVPADPFADLGGFEDEAAPAEGGDEEEGGAVEGLESSFDFGGDALEMEGEPGEAAEEEGVDDVGLPGAAGLEMEEAAEGPDEAEETPLDAAGVGGEEDDDLGLQSGPPVERAGEEPGAPAREPEPEAPAPGPPGGPGGAGGPGGPGGPPVGPGPGAPPGAPAEEREIPSRGKRPGSRKRRRRKKGRLGRIVRPALLVLVVAAAGYGAWQYFGGGGGLPPALTEIVPAEWRARIPFLGAGEGEGTSEAEGPVEPVPTDLPWVVALDSYSDLASARQRIDRLAEVEPTVNFFVAPVGGRVSRFYRLLAGPFPDTTRAIAVGDLLGDRSLGSDPGGYLLRETPLAYELGMYDDRGAAEGRAVALRDRRIPAYILPIPYSDGSERYRIYAGAYADAEEAGLLGSILDDAGIDAELIRLQGRYAE